MKAGKFVSVPWEVLAEFMPWPWPVGVPDDQLSFLSLGWPGWRAVSGFHCGPKTRLILQRNNVTKTVEIDFSIRDLNNFREI
jgi:hypothetical protein